MVDTVVIPGFRPRKFDIIFHFLYLLMGLIIVMFHFNQVKFFELTVNSLPSKLQIIDYLIIIH